MVLCHRRVVVPGKMQVSVVSFPCLVSSQISIFQILRDKRTICMFLVLVSEYWDRWGPASCISRGCSRGGVPCVWYCVTLEFWFQARCKSLLFHSLALYPDESNFHLSDSARLKNKMFVLCAGF